jgi:hypothetical protein
MLVTDAEQALATDDHPPERNIACPWITPQAIPSAQLLLSWQRHSRHDDAAVMEAVVPGHGRVGAVRPRVSPRGAAVRCPAEAVARPVTSASRGPACRSSGRCSRPPYAARRVVLVLGNSDVDVPPGFRNPDASTAERPRLRIGRCVASSQLSSSARCGRLTLREGVPLGRSQELERCLLGGRPGVDAELGTGDVSAAVAH